MKFVNLKQRLSQALAEDRAHHDITTGLIPVTKKRPIEADIVASQAGIFCGGPVLKTIFNILDRSARVRLLKKDGRRVKRNQVVAKIRGSAKAILGAERTALNLICSMSGTATETAKYTSAVKGTGVKIYDTRKTTPLWRDLQKYAVKCGGGENHRMTLADGILVKDNHHKILNQRDLSSTRVYGNGVRKKFRQIQFLEFEAQNYKQVWDGIKARADIVMLDNMSVSQIKGAVKFVRAARKALESNKPLIEISGGVTLKNVKSYAKLGVDRISIGSLTHSAPALDLSLEVH